MRKIIQALVLSTACLGFLNSEAEGMNLPRNSTERSGFFQEQLTQAKKYGLDKFLKNMPTPVSSIFQLPGFKLGNKYIIMHELFVQDLSIFQLPGFKEELANDRNVTTIVLLDGVETIPAECFKGLSNIKNICLSNSVGSIGKLAFKNCNNLEKITINDGLVEIADCAFWGCKNLKHIDIPSSVKIIGSMAFFDCRNLETVYIYNEKVNFCDGVFNCCPSLKQITINNRDAHSLCKNCVMLPNGLRDIPMTLLGYCEQIKQIIVPSSTTKIGDYAFYYCQNLQNIRLPKTLNYIGDAAFYECQNLNEINIPNCVTYIGHEAFANCGSLTKIDILSKYLRLGDKCFCNCPELSEVCITCCWLRLGKGILAQCTETRARITVDGLCISDQSVYQILPNHQCWFQSKNPIQNTADVKTALVPSDFNNINRFFQCLRNLREVHFEQSSIGQPPITRIAQHAFSCCYNLIDIQIPDSVEAIDLCAFENCTNLSILYVPSKVSYIDKTALSGSNVKQLQLSSHVPYMSNNALTDVLVVEFSAPISTSLLNPKAFNKRVCIFIPHIPTSNKK